MKRMLLVGAMLAGCTAAHARAVPVDSTSTAVTMEAPTATTTEPPTTVATTVATTEAPHVTPQHVTPTTAHVTTASPAAPGGFVACVMLRESGNNPTVGGGLYGIIDVTWHSLGYAGHARDAPVTTQTEAFNRLYARYGVSAWRPYDGC